MKFLHALLAQLTIGLVYRLGVPTLCALIVGYFITHPQIADGFSRYPHPATFVIAGLFSAVCSALIISTNSTVKDPMLPVAARTCAVVSAWLFLRLAARQDQAIDAAPFVAIALCLLLATVVSLLTVTGRSRMGGYALYGTAAAVVVMFGVYVSGRKELDLERRDNVVTGTVDTYRWLGHRRVSRRTLRPISDVVDALRSKQFSEAGDGIVLQGDQGELLLPDGAKFHRSIRRFLASQEPSLKLVEQSFSSWTLCGVWLIASMVLVAGLALDPLVPPPQSRLAKQASRLIAANFCLTSCAFLLLSVGAVWQLWSIRSNAKRHIESLGCSVRESDLKARGKLLVGSAWKVTVTDRGFDNARLAELAPHLAYAPGLALNLSNTRVTDAGLQHLNQVELLVMLDLRGTAVSAATLPTLKQLDLRYLDVRDTQIRAADIHDAGFGYLEYLFLSDPGFSRKSVNSLLGIEGLKYVYIDSAGLTPEDLKFWKAELDFEIEIPAGRAEAGPGDFEY